MTDYTASNGYTISVTTHFTGLVRIDFQNAQSTGVNQITLSSAEKTALVEMLDHERDEELGRWRARENPAYVVYPDEDGDVIVLDETTGRASSPVIRSELTQWNPSHATTKAARAYFEAHPERKPWEDAKPGDVWELTYGGESTAHVYTNRCAGEFAFIADRAIFTLGDPDITAGRKIWSEGDAS